MVCKIIDVSFLNLACFALRRRDLTIGWVGVGPLTANRSKE